MKLVISIDMGTTSIVAVAFDVEEKRLLAVESSAANAETTSGASPPGASEWSADRMFRIVAELLKRLVARIGPDLSRLAGIIVTGQQHGVVLLRRDDLTRACSPFIGWMDRRALLPYRGMGWSMEHIVNARLDAAMGDERGCRVSTGYAGATLFALNESDRLPDDAVAAFLPDYINMRLTGNRELCTDSTMAASSGLYDVKADRWSDTAIEILRLPRAVFPKVVPLGTCLGTVAAEMARETGLPSGVPVFQGLGDNQASILGCLMSVSSGGLRQGFDRKTLESLAVVNYGTGSQTTICSERFVTGGSFETRPFPGGFTMTCAGTSGGRTYVLLREFFRRVGRELFETDVSDDRLYERMNDLAASVPRDVAAPTCVPDFYPLRYARDDAPSSAKFDGLTAENFTPGFLVCSLLDGMAAESYRQWLDLRKCRATNELEQTTLFGSGNLLRNSTVCRAMVEKCFHHALLYTPFVEEAAVGAACVLQ